MTGRRRERWPVLLLAGSAEAVALARSLAGAGIPTTASLAGRTRTPADLPVPVRTGGYGGIDGLAAALVDGGFGALVDATHPFAARMPHHAAAAAGSAGVPRLRLLRPPWTAGPADRWHDVADLAGAARCLADLGAARVLLTTGRQELAPFAELARSGAVSFVVRSIEPVTGALPGSVSVTDRGPFTVADETALLRRHGVEVLVTKNSGAPAVRAKLDAARALGLPVVMVRRPGPPAGPVVPTPAEALAWLTGPA